MNNPLFKDKVTAIEMQEASLAQWEEILFFSKVSTIHSLRDELSNEFLIEMDYHFKNQKEVLFLYYSPYHLQNFSNQQQRQFWNGSKSNDSPLKFSEHKHRYDPAFKYIFSHHPPPKKLINNLTSMLFQAQPHYFDISWEFSCLSVYLNKYLLGHSKDILNHYQTSPFLRPEKQFLSALKKVTNKNSNHHQREVALFQIILNKLVSDIEQNQLKNNCLPIKEISFKKFML